MLEWLQTEAWINPRRRKRRQRRRVVDEVELPVERMFADVARDRMAFSRLQSAFAAS